MRRYRWFWQRLQFLSRTLSYFIRYFFISWHLQIESRWYCLDEWFSKSFSRQMVLPVNATITHPQMLIALESYYWRYCSASELVNMILAFIETRSSFLKFSPLSFWIFLLQVPCHLPQSSLPWPLGNNGHYDHGEKPWNSWDPQVWGNAEMGQELHKEAGLPKQVGCEDRF